VPTADDQPADDEGSPASHKASRTAAVDTPATFATFASMDEEGLPASHKASRTAAVDTPATFATLASMVTTHPPAVAPAFSFANPSHSTYISSRFLADVNSRSRSLYVIADPSVVCLSSVCLSVTLVRPTQPAEILGNFFHHTIAQGLVF